jgi:hypothetical protein
MFTDVGERGSLREAGQECKDDERRFEGFHFDYGNTFIRLGFIGWEDILEYSVLRLLSRNEELGTDGMIWYMYDDDSTLDCGSIVGILRGLLEALVGDHLVLDGNQNLLDGGGFLPGLKKTQVLNVAVILVDAGKVDFIIELHGGRFLGVLRSALDAETVDAAVEVGLFPLMSTL